METMLNIDPRVGLIICAIITGMAACGLVLKWIEYRYAQTVGHPRWIAKASRRELLHYLCEEGLPVYDSEPRGQLADIAMALWLGRYK